MQKYFNESNGDGPLSLHSPQNPSSFSRNFPSQITPSNQERKENASSSADAREENKAIKNTRSYNTAGLLNKETTKSLQLQLQANQSKLHNLAKKIDECLSASRANYSFSKMRQASISSLASTIDGKDGKITDRAIPNLEANNEKYLISPESVEALNKSGVETPVGEVAGGFFNFGEKASYEHGKSLLESKPKNIEIPVHSVKPKESQSSKIPTPVQKSPVSKPPLMKSLGIKSPMQKSIVPQNNTKNSNNSKEKKDSQIFSSELQKPLKTVPFLTVETQADSPKKNERYASISPKVYTTPVKNDSPVKEEGVAMTKNKVDNKAKEGGLSLLKKSPGALRTLAKSDTYSPVTAVKMKESTEGSSPQKRFGPTIAQNEQKNNNIPHEKSKSLSKPETKPVFENNNNNKVTGSYQPRQLGFNHRTRSDQKSTPTAEQKESPAAAKNFQAKKHSEQHKAEESEATPRSILGRSGNGSSMKKEIRVETIKKSLQGPKERDYLEFNEQLDMNFELMQAISPVLNDTNPSKRVLESFTPGYNFDGTNNLSISDLKNLSFDLSLLGKDLSCIDNQARRKSNMNERTDTTIKGDKGIMSELKSRSSRTSKPLLGEENTRELLENLGEEEKKKKEGRTNNNNSGVIISKGELKGSSSPSYPSVSDERINRTFERLANDAKKRKALQEEQERARQKQISEEQEKQMAHERNRSKMSPSSKDRLVQKLTEDAQRRRLHQEKIKHAKAEEEIRQANQLQYQGFKAKNNTAKSKVREYLNMKKETNEENIEKDKMARLTTESQNQASNNRAKNSRSQSKGRENIKAKIEVNNENNNLEKEVLLENLLNKKRVRPFEDVSPVIEEKPSSSFSSRTNQKKGRLYNPATPSPIKTEPQETFKSTNEPLTLQTEGLSSLEQLQVLRKNIHKHKSDIEEHIQTIKTISSNSPTRSPTRSNPSSSAKKPLFIRNIQNSGNTSPKSLPAKVPVKYTNTIVKSNGGKNVSSSTQTDTAQSTANDLKSTDIRDMSNSIRNAIKTCQTMRVPTTSEESVRLRSLPSSAKSERENKVKKIPIPTMPTNSRFMSDQAAINYVEKLISDFKFINKV